MKRQIVLVVLFLVIHGLGQDVSLGKTTIVKMDSQQEFLGGRLENIAVTPDGRAMLMGETEDVWTGEDAGVWSVVTAPNGTVYVGTGNDGKLFSIQKDGSTRLLFDSPEIVLTSLSMSPDGNLYAGTAPDGLIYRIQPKTGASSVFFRTEAHYVWDMAWNAEGKLVVATGDASKVLLLSKDGTELNTWSVDADHVRCLALDADSIWFGTSSPPVVYHIIGEDLHVVYEGDGEEISCMATSSSGDIWIAMNPEISISGMEIGPQMALSPNTSDSDSKKRARVFHISTDGVIESWWSTPAVPVFDIVIWKNQPIVSCGQDGYLCGIEGINQATLIGTGEEQPMTCLAVGSDGLYAGTGQNAGLVRILDRPASSGVVTSDVYDAHKLSRWGRLYWTSEGGGLIRIETRSGNRKEPDELWSDWMLLNPSTNGGRIQSPPARFLQWKATLTPGKDGSIPQLDQVEFAQTQPNHAPYFKKLIVYPVTKGKLIKQTGGGLTFRQTLNDEVQVEYRILSHQKNNGLSKGLWLKLKGMRTIRWNVGDEDNDKLLYRVEIRPKGQKRWTLLEKDISTPVCSFDSTLFSDGEYEIKVTASDSPSNPMGVARQAEKISQVFRIDNTPPELSNINVSQISKTTFVISGSADGTGTRIREFAYSINSSDWFLFSSSDGIIDGITETFEVQINLEDEDINRVYLKVTDEQENVVTRNIELFSNAPLH